MNSTLSERLGPRVKTRSIERVSTGSPATFSLTRSVANPNTPAAAVALARRHMPMTDAHRLMTELLEIEPDAALVAEVPMVEDIDLLSSELAECGIAVMALQEHSKTGTKLPYERGHNGEQVTPF